MESENSSERINALQPLGEIKFQPVEIKSNEPLDLFQKIPFTKLSSLGASLNSVGSALKNAATAQGTTQLYEVKIPAGTHLAEFKNGAGKLGTVLSNETNKIAGQAVINPVNPVKTVCFDPTMIFFFFFMANMDRKLDTIISLQREIMEYLTQRDESDMKGNLLFLQDIMKNYRLNWNNSLYLQNNHAQVLTIRRDAEKKIVLYRDQIACKAKGMRSGKLIHNDGDVKKDMARITPLFRDYQMALYMYAYSSFLEVVLLGNFSQDYLSGIIQNLESRTWDYQNLYSQVMGRMEENAQKSLESGAVRGLKSFVSGAGQAIARTPVISKGQVDEALIGAGAKLGKEEKKRLEGSLSPMMEAKVAGVRPFIDNINTIASVYNRPMRVLFDGENIYLKSQEEKPLGELA